jgi:hypothetical protein
MIILGKMFSGVYERRIPPDLDKPGVSEVNYFEPDNPQTEFDEISYGLLTGIQEGKEMVLGKIVLNRVEHTFRPSDLTEEINIEDYPSRQETQTRRRNFILENLHELSNGKSILEFEFDLNNIRHINKHSRSWGDWCVAQAYHQIVGQFKQYGIQNSKGRSGGDEFLATMLVEQDRLKEYISFVTRNTSEYFDSKYIPIEVNGEIRIIPWGCTVEVVTTPENLEVREGEITLANKLYWLYQAFNGHEPTREKLVEGICQYNILKRRYSNVSNFDKVLYEALTYLFSKDYDATRIACSNDGIEMANSFLGWCKPPTGLEPYVSLINPVGTDNFLIENNYLNGSHIFNGLQTVSSDKFKHPKYCRIFEHFVGGVHAANLAKMANYYGSEVGDQLIRDTLALFLQKADEHNLLQDFYKYFTIVEDLPNFYIMLNTGIDETEASIAQKVLGDFQASSEISFKSIQFPVFINDFQFNNNQNSFNKMSYMSEVREESSQDHFTPRLLEEILHTVKYENQHWYVLTESGKKWIDLHGEFQKRLKDKNYMPDLSKLGGSEAARLLIFFLTSSRLPHWYQQIPNPVKQDLGSILDEGMQAVSLIQVYKSPLHRLQSMLQRLLIHSVPSDGCWDVPGGRLVPPENISWRLTWYVNQ